MSKLFWAMLAFISRLPVPSRWSQGLDFEQYSRGIVMFPFIGLILGGVSGLIFILLQPTAWYARVGRNGGHMRGDFHPWPVA